MSSLYSYASATDVTLAGALRDCRVVLQQPSAIALLYAPNWLRFARFDSADNLCGSDGETINLDPVYEARVFNDVAELRWLNKARGFGKAVLLSEEERVIADYSALDRLDPVKTIRQSYLLWGVGEDVTPSQEWSRLTTARIGQLDAPVDDVAALVRAHPKEKVNVLLHAKEYLAVADKHGNVAVCEERLCGLKPLVSKQAARDSRNGLAQKEESNG